MTKIAEQTDEDFIIRFTNKEIYKKLQAVHTDIKKINSKVKLHTKLIFGAYGFTAASVIFILSIIFRYMNYK